VNKEARKKSEITMRLKQKLCRRSGRWKHKGRIAINQLYEATYATTSGEHRIRYA